VAVEEAAKRAEEKAAQLAKEVVKGEEEKRAKDEELHVKANEVAGLKRSEEAVRKEVESLRRENATLQAVAVTAAGSAAPVAATSTGSENAKIVEQAEELAQKEQEMQVLTDATHKKDAENRQLSNQVGGLLRFMCMSGMSVGCSYMYVGLFVFCVC
jgi:hypothetical protein